MKNEILNISKFKRYNCGLNKNRINWNENIGLNVEVMYNKKYYTLTLICYDIITNKVTFTYLNEIQKPMFCGHFIECKFGNIFKDKILIKNKIKETPYEIDYNRCEKELKLNKETVDNLTIGTKIKIFIKCSKCKIEKPNSIVFYNIYKKHSNCQFCSGGLSYPERYFSILMSQLGESYIKTKFIWSRNREYDGYFEKYNLCIELHGNQHYDKGFNTMGGRTIEYEKYNDKYKKHLAKINNIKNYIQIDCRYSDSEYIKTNIIKSLSWLFDFNNVNWDILNKKCENSIVYDICKTWMELEEFDKNVSILSNLYDLSVDTIRIYLKRGSKLWEWCHYNPKEEVKKCAIKSNKLKRKRVICTSTGIIYSSLSEVQEKLKISISAISNCCNKKQGHNTAGGYEWEFYKTS